MAATRYAVHHFLLVPCGSKVSFLHRFQDIVTFAVYLPVTFRRVSVSTIQLKLQATCAFLFHV